MSPPKNGRIVNGRIVNGRIAIRPHRKAKEKMILEEEAILNDLKTVLNRMRRAKPEERSELARRYAVAITELEKAIAYFDVYVVNTYYAIP